MIKVAVTKLQLHNITVRADRLAKILKNFIIIAFFHNRSLFSQFIYFAKYVFKWS